MTTHYIVANGYNHVKIVLPEEQVDEFYDQIQHKYPDFLTIEQNGEKMLVVILSDENEKSPWKEDQEFGNWDTKTDFFEKTECIDSFFEKYPSVILIRIYPAWVVVEKFDTLGDFLKQGPRDTPIKVQRVINEFGRMAARIQSRCPYYVYVSVSDRVLDPKHYLGSDDSDWEPDNKDIWEDAGAVYVGKLTKKQYAVFKREFPKLYKGRYGYSIWWEESYPPEDLALAARLNHYDYLTDDQKEAVYTAIHVANSIRTEDGCESENVPEKYPPKTKSVTKTITQSTEKLKQNHDELHGKKMAAVQEAIKHPETPKYLIAEKYGLAKQALNRDPYKSLIKKGRASSVRERVKNMGEKQGDRRRKPKASDLNRRYENDNDDYDD